MVTIDELFRKAVSKANSVALSGVLGFGFFFVGLVASDKLPENVQWPMQIIMMAACAVSATMIVASPFLRSLSKFDDGTQDSQSLDDRIPDPALPPPSPYQNGNLPRDWRDFLPERTKR